MYHSQELTRNVIREIQENEDRRAYKLGPDHRIVFSRRCAHCGSEFYPRRVNHKFCSASCRVMACYKRKGYKYKSGHYVKNVAIPKEKITSLEDVEKQSKPRTEFNWNNTLESAVAMGAVETVKYLTHDQKVMNILKSIKQTIEGKANNFGGMKYRGIMNIDNYSYAVFQDKNGYCLLNDASGNWYRQNASNANQWQKVLAPF